MPAEKMRTHPIILVEDDPDDIDLFTEASQTTGVDNEILVFRNTEALLSYFKSTSLSPLVIICDVHLAGKDGFETLKLLRSEDALQGRVFPFIYWSTSLSGRQVESCYTEYGAQGIFIKPANFQELCNCLQNIFTYWSICLHPCLVI